MMIEHYYRIAGLPSGRAGLFVLLIALPGLMLAAEWTVRPSLGVQQLYNDNIRLTTLTHPNVATTRIQPKIDFGWATERANIDLLGDWRYNQYAGDPNLENRTDSTYKLKSAYKTERSQFFLDGSYINDTTLAQEDFIQDLGVILTQEDRLSRQLAPAWSWMLNQQSNLRFDLQYQDVAYEKSVFSNYNDYQYDSAGITYSYEWTERDQLYVIVNSSRFNSRQKPFIPANEMISVRRFIGSDSETRMFQAGINHKFSSTLSMRLLYGQRNTDAQTRYQNCVFLPCLATIGAQTSSKTKSPVYTLLADKTFELTNLNVNFSRTVIGSGLGSEMESDNLNITVKHRLTQKMRFGLTFLVNQRVAVNPDFSFNDQTYLRGQVNLDWDVKENWKLYTSYRYISRKYKGRDGVATSNNISLSIRYTWDKISKSR